MKCGCGCTGLKPDNGRIEQSGRIGCTCAVGSVNVPRERGIKIRTCGGWTFFFVIRV